MATESLDRRQAHRRSVTVTAVATLGGVVAGLLTQRVATGPDDQVGLFIMLGLIAIELVILRVLRIEVEDFSKKDHLYVAFMTFSLWFITWTLLLTTGASPL